MLCGVVCLGCVVLCYVYSLDALDLRYFTSTFCPELQSSAETIRHYKHALAMQGLAFHTSQSRKEPAADSALVLSAATQPQEVLKALAADTRLGLWEQKLAVIRRTENEAKAKELAELAARSKADHLEWMYRSQFDANGMQRERSCVFGWLHRFLFHWLTSVCAVCVCVFVFGAYP